jgi:hypothetical protein
VASGSPATLTAGMSANESLESVGALWGLWAGKLRERRTPSLDYGFIAIRPVTQFGSNNAEVYLSSLCALILYTLVVPSLAPKSLRPLGASHRHLQIEEGWLGMKSE